MNKADEARLDAIHAMPCICCVISGCNPQCGKTEAHHITDKGYRRLSGGHQSSLPLGPWHHRGITPSGHTVDSATLSFGPSLFHTSKLFKKIYGTERELLAKVNSTMQPGVSQ